MNFLNKCKRFKNSIVISNRACYNHIEKFPKKGSYHYEANHKRCCQNGRGVD
jgi:hypothetical protein